MFSVEQHHEMVLEGFRSSGAEEWSCPVCGYRFVVRWPPNFDRVILELGELHAVHIGVKGGLRLNGVDVAPMANPRLASRMPTPSSDSRTPGSTGRDPPPNE